MDRALFFLLAALAVASGVGVIAQRSAARSALFLLATFCSLAGLFVLLNAQFVALAQVVVYAGAIVVLFLFVVLLLGAEVDRRPAGRQGLGLLVAGVLLGVLLLAGILWALMLSSREPAQALSRVDNVRQIGQMLLTRYAVPFELTAVVLLVGIVGVVALAKRRLEG